MNGKINVGGNEKVIIDGQKVKEKLSLQTFKGSNPLTIGQDGYEFLSNTLLKDGLQIINGVKDKGKFVWKKMQLVEITMVQTAIKPLTFVVSSEQVDLTNVDVSYFNGMSGKFSNGTWYIENGTLYLNNNARGTLTYTSANRTLASSGNVTATFTWECVSGKKAFVDFVVADTEDAYPNGGELDGYWYELVVEGIDLISYVGMSSFAVDKFTLSTLLNTNGAKLTHSLGKKPKMAILLSDIYSHEYVDDFEISCGMMTFEGSYSSYFSFFTFKKHNSSNFNHSSVMLKPPTETEILFYDTSSIYYFVHGVEYTLITMA